MKKHQVALVGGQRLPIYLGALERKPDVVHLLYTEASLEVAKLLQSCLPVTKVRLKKVDAYDLFQIQNACEDLLVQSNQDVEWELNATGGTKIMSLAAISVFLKKGLSVFYIDQTDHLLEIDKGTKVLMSSTLTVGDFFRLADQPTHNFELFANFSSDEVSLSKHIRAYRGSEYLQLVKEFHRLWPKGNAIPAIGRLGVSTGSFAIWDSFKQTFEIHLERKPNLRTRTARGAKIAFQGGWWEMLVAEKLNTWSKCKEVLMNVVLPFKVDIKSKNEIDILVNLGRQMIFIDCKSGIVKMDDINKLRVVKDTYGGLGAKAALVSLWKPVNLVEERCKEAGIALFSYERAGKSLSSLISFLQGLADSKSL